MAGNSMIDAPFEDEEDFVHDFSDKDDGLPGDEKITKKEPSEKEEIEIELVDDTPAQDRDKWTADKTPTEDGEDEAASYSRKVQERIKKETAKVHAERRAKEDRERQLNELSEFSKRIIQENNQLKSLIENGEKVLVTEHQGRLEGQLAAARAAYREAHEAGDVSGMIAAQENLAKLAAQQDRLSTHRVEPLQRMDEQRELQRFVAPQQPQVDQRALEWKEQNGWFGRDEVMTAFAMGVHQQLVNREGIDPRSADYYNRINSEVKKRFPERFQSENRQAPRRNDPVVAPAGRSGGGNARRKVTLTETQARLARRLGLTLEQYAEQFAAENGNTTEGWTHGF